MNRAGGYMNRAREHGIQWGAVVLGWVVAVLAGLAIGLILNGLYDLVVDAPVRPGRITFGAFFLSLLTGFLAYLVGGYVAGRRAGAAGGINGAMTAVFGLILGIVLTIILVILSVLATGGEGLTGAPVGLAGAGGGFFAVLLLFLFNLLGGYVGGKLGESYRR